MAIKLIVGLGNPGSAYEKTRHNAGVWFIERVAKQNAAPLRLDKKLQGRLASLRIDGQECRLFQSNAFMNVSGQAIRACANYYKIEPDEILVAHDELDLDPGVAKFKTGGGHGGHNGLRDTISALGSPAFHRLRIGIGHPGHRSLVHNFVLGKPSRGDENQILDAIDRAALCFADVVHGDLQKAMLYLHS